MTENFWPSFKRYLMLQIIQGLGKEKVVSFAHQMSKIRRVKGDRGNRSGSGSRSRSRHVDSFLTIFPNRFERVKWWKEDV